jgi:hypothetical protein
MAKKPDELPLPFDAEVEAATLHLFLVLLVKHLRAQKSLNMDAYVAEIDKLIAIQSPAPPTDPFLQRFKMFRKAILSDVEGEPKK